MQGLPNIQEGGKGRVEGERGREGKKEGRERSGEREREGVPKEVWKGGKEEGVRRGNFISFLHDF